MDIDNSGTRVELLHHQPESPRPNALQVRANRFPPYTRINADVLMKLILIGDTGVGKTHYLTKLMRNKTPQYTTIGVDMIVKYAMLYPDELLIKTNIWDTSGQEAFRSILSTYYRTVCGGFYVFNLSARETFVNLKEWIQRSREILPESSHKNFIVLGLMTGKKRYITRKEGEAFALKYGLGYCECINQLGVDESFMKLIQWIWRNRTPETVGIRYLLREDVETYDTTYCCPIV